QELARADLLVALQFAINGQGTAPGGEVAMLGKASPEPVRFLLIEIVVGIPRLGLEELGGRRIGNRVLRPLRAWLGRLRTRLRVLRAVVDFAALRAHEPDQNLLLDNL